MVSVKYLVKKKVHTRDNSLKILSNIWNPLTHIVKRFSVKYRIESWADVSHTFIRSMVFHIGKKTTRQDFSTTNVDACHFWNIPFVHSQFTTLCTQFRPNVKNISKQVYFCLGPVHTNKKQTVWERWNNIYQNFLACLIVIIITCSKTLTLI